MSFAIVLLAAAASAELSARRADEPPVIDGIIGAGEWRGAAASSEFVQKFPREGADPSEATTLRLLYDDDAVYVAFECRQERAPIVARLARRDSPVPSDSVSVALGTRADGRSAFEFGVNAAGVLSDGVRFNDTAYSAEWDENWQANAAVSDHGWSAELRIPLRILRFAAAADQAWDFQARRYIASRQETIEWQLIPRLSGGEVSRYGKLVGLENLVTSSHWELRPFVVGRLRQAPRPGAAGGAERWAASGSAGLDVKYHPSQGLTLDATFNPDFAQVEADQALLNLRNVEAYLPEKRAFFLEGTDVFATPLQLLYTRRIGLFPEDPGALGDPDFGEEYAALPEPTPVYGSSKLTGKLGDDWTLGLLQALTAPTELVLTGPGGRTRRVVAPLSAFGAARLRHDISDGTHVGLSVTAVRRLEDEATSATLPRLGAARSEKLCPSGVRVPAQVSCFNDAYVSSVDWRWSSDEEDWVSVGQLTQSVLQGGPPRYVPDGSVVEPNRLGFGAFTQLIKQSGNFVGDLNLELADRNLDYNDLGYAERSNLIGWSANLEYRLPRVWPLIESKLHFDYLAARNVAGIDLGTGYYVGTSGKFSNLWEYALYFGYSTRRFDDREVGNGLALERAPAAGVDLTLTSDRSKAVSFSLNTVSQWILTGANFLGSLELALRPSSALSFELRPTLSHTLGEPRFGAEGAAPGQYIFGALRATSASLTLRASYAFVPRLTLQMYGQLFLASGDYTSLTELRADGRRPARLRLSELRPLAGGPGENPDFQEAALNLSVVLYWEYVFGSTLYAVYTRAQEIDESLGLGETPAVGLSTLGRAPSVDTLLLKLAFWWSN